MRAVILAGGQGLRLHPYTQFLPKPLLPLGDRYAIVEILILQLVAAGFTHITLAVHHLAQLIIAYFGDGSRLGVRLDYSVEPRSLGTLGPLTLIDDLPDSFLVVNGDILSDFHYRDFLERHIASGASLSVACIRRTTRIDFGVLRCDRDGRLESFEEKPELQFDINMGIYCFHRSVIRSLRRGHRCGLDALIQERLRGHQPVDVCRFDGFWLDVGRPEDYEAANADVEALIARLGLA